MNANWLERIILGLPAWEWLCYLTGFAIGVSGFWGMLP